MACGHGLAPVGPGTTGLQGRVTLAGEWPVDTGIVAVALFEEMPTSSQSALPVIYKEAPEFGASSFDYLWDLQAGVYAYLVVAWLREGDNLFDFDSWVVLGFHARPGSPPVPEDILITPGLLSTIDLIGDFANVPPGDESHMRGKR